MIVYARKINKKKKTVPYLEVSDYQARGKGERVVSIFKDYECEASKERDM